MEASDKQIIDIKKWRFEHNTVKNTQWGVKIFREWLEEMITSLLFVLGEYRRKQIQPGRCTYLCCILKDVYQVTHL